jgi:hypothetical protein
MLPTSSDAKPITLRANAAIAGQRQRSGGVGSPHTAVDRCERRNESHSQEREQRKDEGGQVPRPTASAIAPGTIAACTSTGSRPRKSIGSTTGPVDRMPLEQTACQPRIAVAVR